MIYDISVPIRNGMHVWPSDPQVVLQEHAHPARDGSHTVRVTAIQFGNHSGTHLDAPSHMLEGGKTLDAIPLEQLVGPVRVLDATNRRVIGRADLDGGLDDGVERVLFKTDNSRHWQDAGFYEGFVSLERDAARFLVERGIRLVGTDYLSIDPYGSTDHPAHFVLLEASVVILEGLNLTDVPVGDYQLAALPLKLAGADGAPVRAILMS